MRTEMDPLATRRRNGKTVLNHIGRLAPVFGMIGTLIGLIVMLANMEDSDAVGPRVAVALVPALYEAVCLNVVFLPFAQKLGYY